MPKHYRIMILIQDDDDNEIDSSTHEEDYEDDDEARSKFGEKAQAARGTGRGRSQKR